MAQHGRPEEDAPCRIDLRLQSQGHVGLWRDTQVKNDIGTFDMLDGYKDVQCAYVHVASAVDWLYE